jgi:hypothetical protein
MISSRVRRGYFELLVLVVREVVADVLPHALVDPHTRSYRILSLAPRRLLYFENARTEKRGSREAGFRKYLSKTFLHRAELRGKFFSFSEIYG